MTTDYKYRNKEWLEDQYINKKKSTMTIAKECMCKDETIRTWLHKFNITVRSRSEALTIYCANNDRGPVWNKGLTKETDERVAKNIERMKQTMNTPEMKAKMTGNNNPMKRPEVKTKHLLSCRDPEKIAKQVASRKITLSNPEVLKKLSESLKQSWDKHNPDRHELVHNQMKINNPMKRPEVKEKHKNAVNTPEYKLTRCRGEKHPWYGKVIPKSGRGNGSYYEKKDGSLIWLRSSYETRVATILDKLHLNWEYECTSYALDGSSPYHPDFLIENKIWWEVKGWWRPKSKEKVRLFMEQYPDETLRFIYLSDINKLEQNILCNDNDIDLNNVGEKNLPA